MSAYFDIDNCTGLTNLDLNDASSSPSPTQTTPLPTSTNTIVNEKHFERCLSEDLLSHIFAFCTLAELLLISLVNRRWRRIETNNDGVEWNIHLTKFWSSFNQNVPSTYLLLDRINNLPLSLIKRALFRVDTSRCVEKREYQRMLIARLLFNDRGSKRGGRVFYPEWALRIGQHKASLFHAMKDMKRRDINISELCSIHWRFHFKHSDFAQDDERRSPTWESKFNEDFSMTSGMHSETLTWQFTSGINGRRLMQVEQYPPLTSTRLLNGSWRLDNHYVWFEQMTPLPPDNIPLLDLTNL